MKREARRTLRDYGVDVNVARPLRELGLGAQQMVAIARAVQIEARVVIMDEPTSSLEQREVETLFRVIERLKDTGHRDRVRQPPSRRAVPHLRPGDGDARRPGRARVVDGRGRPAAPGVADAGPRHGRGAGGTGPPRSARTRPAHEVQHVSRGLRAHGLSSRGRLDGRLGRRAAGRGRRPGRPARRRPQRDGEGDRRRAARPRVAPSRSTASGCGATRRRRPSGPVRCMLPEDRKSEGIIPNLSVRENIVLAALPRISRARPGQPGQAGRDRRLLHEAPADQGVQPGAEGQRAVRRQPAEGDAGALAVPQSQGAAARRADPGHRRRRQGRGAVASSTSSPRTGLAVVLISSELEELIEGSDRVVVLKDGSVVGELERRRRQRGCVDGRAGRGSDGEGLVDELTSRPGAGHVSTRTARSRCCRTTASTPRSSLLIAINTALDRELPQPCPTCGCRLFQAVPIARSSRSAWRWSSAPRASTCRSAPSSRWPRRSSRSTSATAPWLAIGDRARRRRGVGR